MISNTQEIDTTSSQKKAFHVEDKPLRVVLLLNNNADGAGNPFVDTPSRLKYEHGLQTKLAEVLPVKRRIDFQKVTRTPPSSSLRTGFQEYRIACELAPNLVVTDVACPWDTVLPASGLPFLALNEQLDEDSLKSLAESIGNTEWTHPMFSRGVAPEGFETTDIFTILADGVHRRPEDEGVVIAMNPMQMFSNPEPDYFLNHENLMRVPIFQEGSTVLRNKWYDTLDMNAVNMPFRMEINDLDFWSKGIERRYMCRGALDLRGQSIIWSPFPQMVLDGNRIGAPTIGVVSAIRLINPNAKIIYRWRNVAGFEIAATEMLEHMLLWDKYGVEIDQVEADECVDPQPLIVHFQPYDLDLTHAGTYMGQWLLSHRSNATMQTAVKGSEHMMPFITAYGFLDPDEVENAKTVTVAPSPLYPS